MGHTINPVSLRLGLNIFWGSNWVVLYNRSNFSYLLGTDYQLVLLLEWLLHFTEEKSKYYRRLMRGLGKNRSLMLSLNILSKLVTRSISKYVIYKDANQMHIKFFLYIEGDSF